MDTVNLKLKKTVHQFPSSAGVYLMKNRHDQILYVGKAKNLRLRVKSYFRSTYQSLKDEFLIRNVKTIDYIVTKSEAEAYLLEASLIKKHKPRYNIRLKDDKAYPYIRCSVKDRFPRFYFERKVRDKKSLYFGPFTQSGAVRHIIEFLNHTFQLRDCSDQKFKIRKRPCLVHQMGHCTAPCVDLVKEEEYKDQFKKALQFLRGRRFGLVKDLKVKMKKMADDFRYEEAGRLKNSLNAMKLIEESQSVVQKSEKNRDVICLVGNEEACLVEFLYLRKGRLIGSRYQFFKQALFEEEVLLSFLNQYYEENLIPDEILLPFPLKQKKLMEKVLYLKKEKPCLLLSPQNKKHEALIDMAQKNAENHLKDETSKAEDIKSLLGEIQKKLHLPVLPLRIECYDISHWQGKETVGAQVVFENGKPKKEDYRLYNLKDIKKSDDYGALQEVLTRRETHKEYKTPDLILIDGGKGQLRAVQHVLKSGSLKQVPLASVAKDRVKDEGKYDSFVSSSGERFYLPNRKNAVRFLPHSKAFQLLLFIRDEAHRFSIQRHRKKRDKEFLKNDLDRVKGLGPKKKEALLKELGSLKKIQSLTEEELASFPFISKALARSIKDVFS